MTTFAPAVARDKEMPTCRFRTRTLGTSWTCARWVRPWRRPTRTLVKTDALDVIRMVVPAGKEIPTHKAKGDLVVQCLEGKIAFTACGKTHDLEAGYLLYLPAGG